MVLYKTKTRQRAEDVAGNSRSAQSVVGLGGALRPAAELQTSQGENHGHKSEDEAGGENCPTDQPRATHDWTACKA